MNYAETDSPRQLKAAIKNGLLRAAKSLDIPVTNKSCSLILKDLLADIYGNPGLGAVIRPSPFCRNTAVCGFAVSEFDHYFSNGMEDLLQARTESGYMPPGGLVSDLGEKTLVWHDGFNWLGPERVLNPYAP
jgi:hypothetical protein